MVIQGPSALRQEQCGILAQVESIPALVTRLHVLWATVAAAAPWISHLTTVSPKDAGHLGDPGLTHFYMVNRTKRSCEKEEKAIPVSLCYCFPHFAVFINLIVAAIMATLAGCWWNGKWPTVCMGGMWSPLRCGSQNGKVCVKGVVSVLLFWTGAHITSTTTIGSESRDLNKLTEPSYSFQISFSPSV